MDEFREIEFEGARLRVYKTGDIWRLYYKNGQTKLKNPYWIKYNSIDVRGYYGARINYKQYKSHRIVAMVYKGLDIFDSTKEVDHIDGIRTNNNIENLRIVTSQQNAWNNTKAKGYYWNKRMQKWHTQLRVNNKLIHIGYFDKEEESREKYLKAKEKYHIIPHNDYTPIDFISPVSDDLESSGAEASETSTFDNESSSDLRDFSCNRSI